MTDVVRVPGAHDAIDGRWLSSWIATFVVAELVGLGGVLLVAVHLGGLVDQSPLGSIALGAVAGGLGGGLVAGLLGLRLRARHPTLELRRWTRGTVAGAVLACCVAAVVPFLRVADPGATAGPGPISQLIFEVCLGASVGMVLAAFQAPALGGFGVRPRTWLLGNAAGWAAAMPVAFVAVDRPWTTVEAVGRGAVLVGVIGALVGITTGLTLWHEAHRDEGAQGALVAERA